MKNINLHLKKLERVERKKYHPLIRKLHKKYNLSKKTLFYVKEYGSKANVTKVILKESLRVLIIASIFSSLGGIGLEHMKTALISIFPLIVLIPTLNDIIGDYGTIISSRFATLLHEGKVKENALKSKEVRKMIKQIFIISTSMAIFGLLMALGISNLTGHPPDFTTSYKILLISIIDTILIVCILLGITIASGIYLYKRKEDPNNFLIPISTSVADLGNMIIIAILISIFF